MEIRLEDVWFSYDGSRYVIRSANMEFKDRGLYLIIGPNGSGKTTLLKITSLIYKPTRGRVLLDGKSYWDLGSKERDMLRQNIVFVHDKPILLRGDVWYNVNLGLELRGLNNREYLEELMKRYGLSELARVNIRNLSAGQKKLVSIVRALALKPNTLIVDEPFNHLDISRAGILLEDLTNIARNSMVIVATHYAVKEMSEKAKEVYEIIAGSIRKI